MTTISNIWRVERSITSGRLYHDRRCAFRDRSADPWDRTGVDTFNDDDDRDLEADSSGSEACSRKSRSIDRTDSSPCASSCQAETAELPSRTFWAFTPEFSSFR